MAIVGNTIKVGLKFSDFDGVLTDATEITIKVYEDGVILETFELDDTDKVATGVYEYYYEIPEGKTPLILVARGLINGNPEVNHARIQRYSRI